jgi:hypothetical protein
MAREILLATRFSFSSALMASFLCRPENAGWISVFGGLERQRLGLCYEAGQEIKATKKAYPQMSQMNADEQKMRK